MATFPALPVTGRTFAQGVYPHTAHNAYNGRQVRVRHSNTVVGNLLRLRFDMLSRTEMLSLQSHYAGQLGGFLAFAIPDDVLDGINTPATVTPTDHKWVYVAPPRVTDVAIDGASPSNRYVVEVELASVPPESTIASGSRLLVVTSWRPGYAPRPLALGVTLTWAPGGVSALVPGLAETATTSWEAGYAPRPLALSATSSWEPGTFGGPGLAITALASFTGGAASDGGASPTFEATFIRPVYAFDLLYLWDGEDW